LQVRKPNEEDLKEENVINEEAIPEIEKLFSNSCWDIILSKRSKNYQTSGLYDTLKKK